MINFLAKKGVLPLLVSAFVLTIFGLSTLYSASGANDTFYKQLTIVVISIICGLAVYAVNFRFLRQGNVVFYGYIATLLLLLLILLLGVTVNSSQSWFRFGGFSLQPSELAKLAVIAVLAKYLFRRHIEIANVKHVLMSFAYAAVAGLLVLKQPDLGSALVIFGIWAIILFVSGVSKKHILIILVIAGTMFYIAWQFVFLPYQKDRILNFVDPLRDVRGSGYNVYQSIIAVGSGGFYGKGISQGTQSTLRYLPESDTDFIFASFAEEWGFVGVSLAILFFSILIISIFILALSAETNFETLFIVGVGAYFMIHFIVNVGMNLGLLPVTGIPLPFMSAGGTHTLLEWIMLGMTLSMVKVGSDNRKSLTNKEFFTA
jgi:rod shape determining protein RodA